MIFETINGGYRYEKDIFSVCKISLALFKSTLEKNELTISTSKILRSKTWLIFFCIHCILTLHILRGCFKKFSKHIISWISLLSFSAVNRLGKRVSQILNIKIKKYPKIFVSEIRREKEEKITQISRLFLSVQFASSLNYFDLSPTLSFLNDPIFFLLSSSSPSSSTVEEASLLFNRKFHSSFTIATLSFLFSFCVSSPSTWFPLEFLLSSPRR